MRNPLRGLRRRRALAAAAALPSTLARTRVISWCADTFRVLIPGEQLVRIRGYPGFAVQYNPRRDRNFKAIVTRLLDEIAASATGATLLNDIVTSAPTSNVAPPVEGRAASAPFPAGVLVIIRPPPQRDWRNVTIPNTDPPQVVAVPQNALSANYSAAADPTEAGLVDGTGANGGGSVSTVQFNEQVAWTSQGEAVVPSIALAHELIHVRHHLYGETRDGRNEEYATTGLFAHRNDPLTENQIRAEKGLPRRTRFYPDDPPGG